MRKLLCAADGYLGGRKRLLPRYRKLNRSQCAMLCPSYMRYLRWGERNIALSRPLPLFRACIEVLIAVNDAALELFFPKKKLDELSRSVQVIF